MNLFLVADPFTDRGAEVGPGATAVAQELARAHGLTPRTLPADVDAIRAALDAQTAADPGGRPVVVASECSVALATLPWLAAAHPTARVLWLDAHGDFNTPQTSISGYEAGMAVAGATGVWDAGAAPALDPARLVYAGVRDLDAAERALLEANGATLAPDLDAALDALGDAPVFVHLDTDVVAGYPTAFPTAGGPSADAVRALLTRVAADHRIVGVTIASVAGPPDVPATLVEPLL
jgi:arginase family enzyme